MRIGGCCQGVTGRGCTVYVSLGYNGGEGGVLADFIITAHRSLVPKVLICLEWPTAGLGECIHGCAYTLFTFVSIGMLSLSYHVCYSENALFDHHLPACIYIVGHAQCTFTYVLRRLA